MALIGATGGMGRAVFAELIRREMPVRAIVRRPDAVTESDLVRPVIADVVTPEVLVDALRGMKTVISAFNPGWGSEHLYENYRAWARAIWAACVSADVSRLIVVGGASSLIGPDGHELIEHGLPPEPYGSGVRAARDLLHEMREQNDLDWVYVSPPMDCGPMGPKGRTCEYRIGHDHPVIDQEWRSALSVEDLAVLIIDEVAAPRFHRERVTAAY